MAMSEVTELLNSVRRGEPGAAGRLMEAVYAELNRLAAGQLAGERVGSLSPTALVHEAYLRLAGQEGELSFENRGHFFGAAGRAMRRVLVDAARRRGRDKRGGGAHRAELTDVADVERDQRLVALDEALGRLEAEDASAARVVELHHFAGLSHEQTAEALGTTVYDVRQKWAYARAWLLDALR